MISLKLDSQDLGLLVDNVKAMTGLSVFDKLRNFKLNRDNLVFDQSFVRETTVQVKLSCDAGGKLLIEIARLADSELGNLALKPFQGVVTGIIEKKTESWLVKESERVLSFDPRRLVPARFHSVRIQNGKLAAEVELFRKTPPANAD